MFNFSKNYDKNNECNWQELYKDREVEKDFKEIIIDLYFKLYKMNPEVKISEITKAVVSLVKEFEK